MNDLYGFPQGNDAYRPAPFWSWNDQLNPDELRAQMRKMKEAGYGGFFMHSRVGLITRYLSDEWMELVRMCSEESEALGLSAWLYDEDMWPSGYASGMVPAMDDAFKEKALVLIPEEEIRPTDDVWKRVAVRDHPCVIAARTCAAGMLRFNNQCYIDTMNPHAIRAFLNSTHEVYKEKMGEMFGKQIRGIFTDEPCYGIHWFYPMPHVTYSEYLRARIKTERGYDIADFCESLFFNVGDYKRIRYDYFSIAGRQFADSYTRQIAEWCAENHLLFTGHLMAEETLCEQAQWTGGLMMHYAYMQQPGVDKLMRHNTQSVTLKQLTSVCEQLEKPRALSECFAGIGHESGFYKRKQIMDWQAVNGIDFVNMHLSHYSLRGERKRDYPPVFFYQQPYFEQESLFSDYAARLSQIAGYGKRDVRVLIVEPLGSVFAAYHPAEPDNQQKTAMYDRYLTELCESLQSRFIDFHLGDESVMRAYGRVQDGTLMVGACAYDAVILCHCESLESSTVSLLRDFNGQIFVLGQTPTLCEYRQTIDVRVDAAFDQARTLADALIPYRSVDADAEGGHIIACRRLGEGGRDICLFANTGETHETLRFPAMRGAFLLDMTRGVAYPAETDTVKLYPYGSLAVYMGGRADLQAMGIPILPIPPLYGDGVDVSLYTAHSLPTPAAHVCRENALVLDRVDFEAGAVKLTDVPLEAIWHYHFYKLPEGTPYTLRYRFTVATLPDHEVQVVIENAENTDSITLNGMPVTPLRARGAVQCCDDSAYMDLAFTRCRIAPDALTVGENVLEVKACKYNNITDVCNHRTVTEDEAMGGYRPTEAEAAYIIGDFAVRPFAQGYAMEATVPADTLTGDISTQGYPFYSGSLTYTFDCDLSGEDMIRLTCDCTYAKLVVDGTTYIAGVNPYVFDTRGITGHHTASLTLYNSLFALLGPHHIRGYDDLVWVDAGVFNDLNRYEQAALIKPFGLFKIETITADRPYENEYRKEDVR